MFIVPAHTNPSCEAAVKAVRARAQQSALHVNVWVCESMLVCVHVHSMYIELYMYVSMYLYIIYKRAIE